ncbi:hypothetical protein EDD27_7974 [Nonomuraea polychroma]|uniref:Uncharacterized protein n=1 Tax=Nonomuraea polychroma TaxID=46176 RepID=A0A438MID5_9ACTN|nr:hypothetical protein EDD27_7974 [Nonomuraea polychroma]
MLRFGEELVSGGLLSFKIASEFIHQGGRFREGVVDGIDTASELLAWVFLGLPQSFEVVKALVDCLSGRDDEPQ